MHDERVIRRRHGSGLPRAVALAVALAVLGAGCASSAARARGSAEVLRLGVFATLSHAPAIVGIASGIFARELAPTRVEVHVFGSGVDAGVALLAGSIDAAYLGPWPAVSLFVRSGKVAVVSGAALGGASLIGRRGVGAGAVRDLARSGGCGRRARERVLAVAGRPLPERGARGLGRLSRCAPGRGGASGARKRRLDPLS